MLAVYPFYVSSSSSGKWKSTTRADSYLIKAKEPKVRVVKNYTEK
jgi:hypothetical protein